MSSYLKEKLQELRSKKAIIITKTKGYLEMLLNLLDIDSPEIRSEISKIKKELDELIGSIYQSNSLLGILEEESYLIRLLLEEEKREEEGES